MHSGSFCAKTIAIAKTGHKNSIKKGMPNKAFLQLKITIH